MFRIVKVFETSKILPTDFVIVTANYLEFAVDNIKRFVVHCDKSGSINESYSIKNSIMEKTII